MDTDTVTFGLQCQESAYVVTYIFLHEETHANISQEYFQSYPRREDSSR